MSTGSERARDSRPADGGPPSAAELVEALLTVSHAIRRRHNARLAGHDLSLPRSRLLLAMAELHRPRMSDLAAHLGLTARTITTAVDALEREGVLARLSDPHDRRAILVELTPTGRSQIDGVHTIQRELSEEVMSPLGAGERRLLLVLLSRIQAAALGR